MTLAQIAWTVFVWVLLTLTVFRISRFIASDDLTIDFRRAIDQRFGTNSNWATLVNCMWCVSTYITIGTYLIAEQYLTLPLVTLQALGSWAVAGYMSIPDE